MTATYAVALEAHTAAYAIYRAAVDAYYAGGSDEDFANARLAKRDADAAFDAAFEVASNEEAA